MGGAFIATYAERDWPRMLHLPAYAGRKFTDVACHPERLDQPLRWKRPRRIFVNSMSDLFHPDVPDRFIADVFGVMAAAHWHTFQLLTKRPQRMRKLLGSGCIGRFEADAEETAAMYSNRWPLKWPLRNVWVGVSVEDQATADERVRMLLDTPAAVRWISAEPLVGEVDIWRWLDDGSNEMALAGSLDWVVVGGETGHHARPMHPDWVRSLRDQCAAAGVPFLFKQWGEWAENEQHGFATGMDGGIRAHRFDDGTLVERIGKRYAGRLIDGAFHNQYP